MKPWHSTDRNLTRRSLKVIIRELRRLGRLRLVLDAIPQAKGSEDLIGFNIFTDVGPASPRHWMLPKVTCDEETLIQAYEAFVEQPLGVVRRPGKVVEEFLAESGVRNVKGTLAFRPAGSWFHTAARLLAMGLSVEGAQLDTDWATNTFTLALNSATLSVSPDKVYSNFMGVYITAVKPAEDPLAAIGTLSSVTTGNKTLVTLHRAFRGLPDLQMAVRCLAECLAQGVITESEIKREIRKASEVGLLKGLDPGRPIGEAREQAVAEALSILGGDGEGLMRRLYKAIVPLLFTSLEFSKEFGSTAQASRRPRLTTLEAWAQKITARADRLSWSDQQQQEEVET